MSRVVELCGGIDTEMPEMGWKRGIERRDMEKKMSVCRHLDTYKKQMETSGRGR